MRIKPLLFLTAGVLTLGGCGEEHHHHRQPPPPIAVEPAPPDYVYYNDPSYYGGYYDQNYWYWRDRDGRMHREMREEHDRHLSEHPRYEERGRNNQREGYQPRGGPEEHDHR